MLTEKTLLDRVQAVATWRRGQERAPHKPLFLLYVLGRFAAGQTSVTFAECRQDIVRLLREFGPSRRHYHAEYPFWRLQSDRLWIVEATGPLPKRASNTDPTAKALVDTNAVGEFPKDVICALRKYKDLVSQVAQTLLANHFAESLHDDIRNAVGLSIEPVNARHSRRDPEFRRVVLRSYRFACAVCGFSLRLEDTTIGLDAAHIRWRQARGPDIASNGLALCALHHKLFDIGAFTLDTESRVVVSERISGGAHLGSLLITHHGRPIMAAVQPENRPDPDYVRWHRTQVFKERPLPLI